MPTARRLITNALRTLNVTASGETPSAAEASDALEVLNEMLEQWDLEELMVYTIVRNILTLTATQGTYTLGTGGDWNIARPIRIDRAFFRETATELELPAKILSEEEYQGIRLKGTTGSWPRWIYNDRAYPLSTVTAWPVPAVGNQIVLYTWGQLGSIANLDTSWDFPPGYAMALRYNLAVALAPEFARKVSVELASWAASTKMKIKTVNTEVPILSVDPALHRGQGWDWQTGETI